MILTEKGEQLFNEIEASINKLLKAEEKIISNKEINFGTYNTIISKLLSGCINKYYENNSKRKINIINNKIEDMIYMLQNSELDLILSKKIEQENNYKKIKYIKLAELEEVIITNNNSILTNKIIEIDDLKDEIIYMPRNNSASLLKIIKRLESQGLKDNIKRIDSSTMLKLLENGQGVGIITKEYIKEELELKKISIVQTKFKLEKSELGLYLRKDNKNKELKIFVDILKKNFEDYN